MHAHRQPFDKGGGFEAHFIRETNHSARIGLWFLHQNIGSECTSVAGTADTVINCLRVNDNPVARAKGGNLVADLLNHPCEFVPDGHGHLHAGQSTQLEIAQVRTANPAVGDFHQNIPGPDFRYIDFIEPDFPRRVNTCSRH